jgi:hypothetical protein
MLATKNARASDLFFLGVSVLRRGKEGTDRMRSTHPEFSEETLSELLRALHARTSGHPDNPGLVASWPAVPETRMDAACGELAARGHALFRIAIPGRVHDGWAIRSTTQAPPWPA